LEPEIAFGEVLRARRKEAGLSQEKLALDVGLERTFISMMERGQRQPSLTTLLKIAPALGCEAADLVADVERLIEKRKSKR
jgi:transcriptional regulator with XRE-family HTH domain